MIPDLASYDIIEINSSAGKDSQAMLFYVAGLLREQGLLDRGVVVHADLGRVEWPGTRDLAAEQARLAGLRFVARARPQGDLLAQVRKLGKWPMPTQRFCTADHKRGQILFVLGQLAAEHRQAHKLKPSAPVRILNCVGLRAEESPGRKRAPELHISARGTSSRRQIDMWLPIQAWTAAEVWAAVRASKAPSHPAYAAGLPRASCILCIYAPEEALRRAGRANPAILAEYVETEQAIGHTFRRHLPIAKIAADIAAGVADDGPIDSWCM
jgi:3'-phosphoadenosine 5'-phosphosulfate sulfotransferase (PAPS reductase)/FAD synthetase